MASEIVPNVQPEANVGKCIDYTTTRTIDGQTIVENFREYKITEAIRRYRGTNLHAYRIVSEKGNGNDTTIIYPFMITKMYHCEQQGGRRRRKTRKGRKGSKRTKKH